MAVSALVYSLSTQPESFGRTTLEALALGRPVVGYDHGGVGELLGQLFPAGRVPLGNEAALATVSRKLLADPVWPAPVPASLTLAVMLRHTLDVYHELLAAARA